MTMSKTSPKVVTVDSEETGKEETGLPGRAGIAYHHRDCHLQQVKIG
jgi:hypothetical protein